MKTEQYSKDGKLRMGQEQPTSTGYYDFGFQDQIDKTFIVSPGDSFSTTCMYDTKSKSDVVMGLGSEQEMCINFLLYYPANEHLERNGGFCGAEGFCGGRVTKKLQSMDDSAVMSIRTWPATTNCSAYDEAEWRGKDDSIVASSTTFTAGVARTQPMGPLVAGIAFSVLFAFL